jgi:hypothetical protein
VIGLALTVSTASIVYLFTELMIPGLIPLASAGMLVPIWQQQRKHKVVSILLIVSFVLNIIAGIMQIASAVLR